MAQGGAERQEEEDAFIRDNGHLEKRKREGRQGGAEDSPIRRPIDNDSDNASAEATPRKKPSPVATRMVTRSAEKASVQRDNVIELSSSRGSLTPSS